MFRCSSHCLTEFELALHHNVTVFRKKRLVLMMLGNPLATIDDPNVESLRQFIRQYTYIDYDADDWVERLLYALPVNGLAHRQELANENTPLLCD